MQAKKSLSFTILSIIAVLITGIFFTPSAEAAEATKYGLKVLGQEVTDLNERDILGDGVFSFDPDTNTLSVNGSCTNDDPKQPYGIINNRKIENLIIDVTGDSLLTNNYGIPISSNVTEGSITITSSENAVLKLAADNAVISTYSNLIIDNANIEINSIHGIHGYEGDTLTIKNSSILANCTGKAIWGFGDLQLEDCNIMAPSTAKIINGTIYESDGETIAANVTIGTAYGLTVAGTVVTSLNARDILGDGVFGFDPTTNTLTVKGRCIYDGTVIDSSIKDLTINAAEDAWLICTKYSTNAIVCREDTKITGDCKLTVNSTEFNGIIIVGSDKTLTIENADISVNGKTQGIIGRGFENLVIKNSSVSASGSTRAIGTFANITLEGCEITDPEDATINNGKIYTINGVTAAEATNVVIEPQKYALDIAGVPVTTQNAADVLGNGVFAFDANTNTLTVNGDYTFSDGFLISNALNGLTVYAAGNSSLTNNNGPIIYSYPYCDLTVKSANNTVLKMNGSTDISVSSSKLTIENTNIRSNGYYGLSGGNSGTLLIKNSYIETHNKEKAIYGFSGGITLDGSAVLYPSGAVCNTSIGLRESPEPAKNVIICKGDVNFDKVIDKKDEMLILKYISAGTAFDADSEINKKAIQSADVDFSKDVDILDVIKLMKTVDRAADYTEEETSF